jgi:hypothetical protein
MAEGPEKETMNLDQATKTATTFARIIGYALLLLLAFVVWRIVAPPSHQAERRETIRTREQIRFEGESTIKARVEIR